MSDGFNGVFKSGDIERFYGPYRVVISIEYDPDLDCNVEKSWTRESFGDKGRALVTIGKYILEAGTKVFDWIEEKLTKLDVDERRTKIEEHVVDVDELADSIEQDYKKRSGKHEGV